MHCSHAGRRLPRTLPVIVHERRYDTSLLFFFCAIPLCAHGTDLRLRPHRVRHIVMITPFSDVRVTLRSASRSGARAQTDRTTTPHGQQHRQRLCTSSLLRCAAAATHCTQMRRRLTSETCCHHTNTHTHSKSADHTRWPRCPRLQKVPDGWSHERCAHHAHKHDSVASRQRIDG